MTPDPWQADLLNSDAARILLCCSRQAGKTRTVAALVLQQAVLAADSTCLIVSPSERQSGEFLAVIRGYCDSLRRVGMHPPAVTKQTELQIHFANGSRIIGLPESERTVRTYSSVRLIAIDEAARVDDALYFAVRPMLAVSRGRLIALSTPFGQRGWFYDEWHQGTDNWQRIRVTADQCPRIPPETLAADRKTFGRRYFDQEYMCSFEAAAGSLFDPEAVAAAVRDDVKPLFGGQQ